MRMPADMYEGPNGIVKLEYTDSGLVLIKTWEKLQNNSVLETLFSQAGAILDQAVHPAGEPKSYAIQFINGAHLELLPAHYEEVRLGKNCPRCSGNLTRAAQDGLKTNNIPVMPIYICISCSAKSYYLTSRYLERLVERKESLFSDDEIGLYKDDTESFINDLKQYINRVFASKHIYEIK